MPAGDGPRRRGDGGTVLQYKCHFSIENHHFSGAIPHYLCIVNAKFKRKWHLYLLKIGRDGEAYRSAVVDPGGVKYTAVPCDCFTFKKQKFIIVLVQNRHLFLIAGASHTTQRLCSIEYHHLKFKMNSHHTTSPASPPLYYKIIIFVIKSSFVSI